MRHSQQQSGDSGRMNPGLLSSNSDEWTTPRDLFNRINKIFSFQLDAAADSKNTLCEKFYSLEDCGLNNLWTETTWCNPPYSRVAEFVRHAFESTSSSGRPVILLIPARPDTRYWHDYIFGKSDIIFIKGRLKFGAGKNSAPFPSALIVYGAKKEDLAALCGLNLGYMVFKLPSAAGRLEKKQVNRLFRAENTLFPA